MSNSLPQLIPPQTAPFGEVRDGKLYVDVNWYLFLYNLGNNVLPFGGGVPINPTALIAESDTDAAQTDIPQAYKSIINLAALTSQNIDIEGADVAGLYKIDANAQALLPDLDVALTRDDVINIASQLVNNDIPALAQADIAGLTTASSPTFAGLNLTGNLVINNADNVAFKDNAGTVFNVLKMDAANDVYVINNSGGNVIVQVGANNVITATSSSITFTKALSCASISTGGNSLSAGSATVGNFGCNGKSAQSSVAADGTLTTVQNALIACGIMS